MHAVDPPIPVTVTAIAPPSSTPLPGEDNEEAIGNLGLEDADEVEDQSLRMPEDVSSSAGGPESKAGKRKIDEVADSEDEDGIEVEIGTAARLPLIPRVHEGFLASSQLTQDGLEADEQESALSARIRPPKTVGVEDHRAKQQDLEDDMLLQN